MKTIISFGIDPLIVEQFQNIVPRKERSTLIEALLISFINNKNIDGKTTEAKLLKDKEDLKMQAEKIYREMTIIDLKVQKILQDKKKTNEENIKEGVKILQTIKLNPGMHEDF